MRQTLDCLRSNAAPAANRIAESAQPAHSAKERGYKNHDEINVSKAGLGDLYEEKIKGFFRSVGAFCPPIDLTGMRLTVDSLCAASTCTRTRRSDTSRTVAATLTCAVSLAPLRCRALLCGDISDHRAATFTVRRQGRFAVDPDRVRTAGPLDRPGRDLPPLHARRR